MAGRSVFDGKRMIWCKIKYGSQGMALERAQE